MINISLFMLLIYATLINLLFLVNGLLLISSYNYIYSMFCSYLLINNMNLDISLSTAFIGKFLVYDWFYIYYYWFNIPYF